MSIKLPSVGNGGGLTNGAIVNGIALFFGDTPPPNRINGNPLVDGDLFTEKGVRSWQRKSPYWVSEPFSFGVGFSGAGATTNAYVAVQSGLIYLDKITIFPAPSFNFTGSAYWTIALKMYTGSPNLGNSDTSYSLALNRSYNSAEVVGIDTAADHFGAGVTLGAFGGVRAELIKTGAVGNFTGSFVVDYRIIRS